MICQFLLGYLIPKSSLFCLCVGWLVCLFYMSTLVRIFNTKVFFFCLCVGWLFGWLFGFMICQLL